MFTMAGVPDPLIFCHSNAITPCLHSKTRSKTILDTGVGTNRAWNGLLEWNTELEYWIELFLDKFLYLF